MYMSGGVRTCRFCDSTDTSPENWPQRNGKPVGTKCRACLVIYHNVQRHLTPTYKAKARARKLKGREVQFDIVYDDQLRIQMGVCASCDRPFEGLLVFDHDHSCCKRGCPVCFRGLLCPDCNSAEGLLGGDPARIRALADYVESGGWEQVARA